jgi:hypothetical protein
MLASKGFRSFSRLTGTYLPSICDPAVRPPNRAARLSARDIPELLKPSLSDMRLPSQGQCEMPFHRRRSRGEAGNCLLTLLLTARRRLGEPTPRIYSGCRARPVA